MTGFGLARESILVSKGTKVAFAVEIKSLNSRFFEVACKLPSALNSLEIKITDLLKKKLIRGRIYLTLRASEDSSLFQTVMPNLSLIKDLLIASNTIKKEFKLKGDLSVSELLNLPNIFISEEKVIGGKTEQEILKLIEKATDLLLKTRADEGNNLKKDLEKFFSISAKKMSKIKKLFIKMMSEKKEAIKKVLLLSQEGDEGAKLKLDELYSTVSKIDVSEEITRFDSHLKSIKSVLKDKIMTKGKRLDFVLQELVRELNTINAKSSSYDISALAVDIKVELEKAREQVQNIV